MSAKHLILLIFILISDLISAQILNGEYRQQDDYLRIKDDSISFFLTQQCGLLTTIRGNGKFEIIKDFLIIHTSDYTGEKSILSLKKSNDNKIDFQISDLKANPIMGVNIVAYTPRGKIISGTVSDNEGNALLDKPNNLDKIGISLVGYDDVKFKYSPNSDYHILLTEGKVVENNDVIFEIIKVTEESLILSLITTNFDFNKLNLKTLRQIKKYKKRNNCTINELKKTVANTL